MLQHELSKATVEAEKLEKKLAAREAMLQDTLRQLSVSKFLLQDLQQDQSAAKVGCDGVAPGVACLQASVSCSVTCRSRVLSCPYCSMVAACGPPRASWSLQNCSSVGPGWVLDAACTHELLELDPGQTPCPAGEQIGGGGGSLQV